MARLQILQLPAGADDDRPPFVLVIDEAATGPDGELLIKASDFVVAREDIGACDVFLFEETVAIPANEPLPLLVKGDAQTAELINAHERTRLALWDALLLSRDTTWHQLVEAAGEQRRSAARLAREFDAVTANPLDIRVYLGEKEIDVDEVTRRVAREMKRSVRNGG